MQLNKANQRPVGKTIGDRRYLHVDALPAAAEGPQAEALLAAVARAEALAGVRRGRHFNLVRLEASGGSLGLLHYPGFADAPFRTRRRGTPETRAHALSP